MHYVLSGRNGTGKSTILRALAENRIPGVALNLRILLLNQTRLEDDTVTSELSNASDISAKSASVLEYVIKSNKKRMTALKESQVLSQALEDTADPAAAVRASRAVKHDRLLLELHQCQQIALRRSGARGSKARQELIKTEERVKASQQLLDEAASDVDPNVVAEEINDAAAMLEQLNLSLEDMDVSTIEQRAKTVLLGVGFLPEMLEQPVSKLSGGWQTRCDLACALIQDIDVLLLDEPTNFLDLPAVLWLQNYITTLTKTSVIVVTHDRDFADAVAEQLILVRINPEFTLETFKGNLSAYEKEKRQQIKRMTRMQEAQDKKVKHMENTIASNIRAAKRTGDDKKLKQAASRKKKVEERTGLEVSAKGGRFKLNRDLAGYHLTNRAEIEIPEFDPSVSITLPSQEAELRFPGSLISVENATYRYTKTKTTVLDRINLVIQPNERLAIAGVNGAGKSTLIGLLNGSLQPRTGTVTPHPRLLISTFSQASVEVLTELSSNDPTITALSYLQAKPEATSMSEQDVRALLSGLGLRGTTAASVPLHALSGGQKVRVALAEALLKQPHLLILDEVTTHLDADTITALADALMRYTGALLVVSHDRWFVRRVIERQSVFDHDGSEDSEGSDDGDDEEQLPGKVYMLADGKLTVLEGGIDEYERKMEKKIRKK